jgi:hypothetical protein
MEHILLFDSDGPFQYSETVKGCCRGREPMVTMVTSPGLLSAIPNPLTAIVPQREGGWAGDDGWNPAGASCLGYGRFSFAPQSSLPIEHTFMTGAN